MKKYLFFPIVVFFVISINSQAQISFQPSDTIQFNTEQSTFAELVDIDEDGQNELVYKLDNKIYSKKNFQDKSISSKSLIIDLDNISIHSITNFVDYNGDGHLDFGIVAFDSEETLKSYIYFIKGSEDGFSIDYRREITSIYFAKFIDINNDDSFELFYSEGSRFGYVEDWTSGIDGFDVEIQQEAVTGIEAVDYDKDGDLDIVATGNNSFNIYTIGQNQEFEQVYSVETEYTSNIISYGDINLDGFTDFIFRNQNNVYSLIYDNGGFIKTNITESLTLINVRSPKLVDIDQNNTLDVVFRDQQDRLAYLRNQSGTIDQLQTIGHTGIRFVDKLLFDDFDQDGFIDILTYNSGVYDLIYTDQNQEIKEISSGEFYNQSNGISSFDMDNDGNKDLVSIATSGSINITYNYKNNLNGEPIKHPIQRGSENLNIFDVDNDGLLDVFYYKANLSGGNSELYLMKGLGNRDFEEPVQWKYVPYGDTFFETDLNNDGVKEFLTFMFFYEEIVIVHPNSGDTDDYFNSENVISIQNGNGITAIDLGDISGNGSEDIVTANYESQNVSILINDGTGAFTESNIEVGQNVNSVRIFDYDFDGDKDLLLTVENQTDYTEKLQIYLNDGQLGFNLSEEFELDIYQAIHIDILDLDNDEDKDILVSGYSFSSQEVFENINSTYEKISVDIDASGQVYRIFDDINEDGKVDFFSKRLNYGNTFIHYNNSVSSPSINDFNLNIQETGYSNIRVSQSDLTASGYIVLLKEDSSSTLNDLPVDNSFYAANSSLGVGGQIDGAYVVYSGSASSFEINGLAPSSNYKLFAFPYNSNSPNNTIINYTDEFISLNIVTDSSIYLLQELPVVEVDEDSSTEFDLTEYIFDDGINTYSASSEVEDVELSFDSNILIIESLNDFNGEAQFEIMVANEHEEKGYMLQLLVKPVNDAPVLQEGSSLQIVGLESSSFRLYFKDVDDAVEELSMNVTSSNDAIINPEGIDLQITDDSIQVNFTPLNFGTTTITMTVSDSEFETSTNYEIEVTEQVLSNLSKLEGVRIYPNPVSDLIHFEGINENMAYRILTLNGKLVMEGYKIPEILDISKLEDGVYIMVANNKKLRFIKK
ncbi:FG-GAP-like repeat-containing protein [Marivirga salinae]|uniref:FG-GAP-like repeat-containing protein n=1 Tax=Marivirga salinarum TaxID=3059078 RepID=A0AA51N8T5_9BACT|nr:FG-GAP-like repeat-containing protein [Marivirga sp. BDSF4-3]WMN10897.1 FG-GAP-like repeat-containing protein [Marivirga sp. BDSF4-3]